MCQELQIIYYYYYYYYCYYYECHLSQAFLPWYEGNSISKLQIQVATYVFE